MRIPLALLLFAGIAGCAVPPPAPAAPPAHAPGPPIAVAPTLTPPPAAVAAAPQPPAVALLAPVPSPVYFLPHQGRLTLSNVRYGLADVEALVTPYPDCAVHPGQMPMVFKLRLNSTWVIPTPSGSDVCWRRELKADQHPATPPTKPGWTEWNRVFTAGGAAIDSRL